MKLPGIENTPIEFVRETATDVILKRKCPFCGKTNEMTFPKKECIEGIQAYKKGAAIQDAFPTFTADQREFIMTGIDDCFFN